MAGLDRLRFVKISHCEFFLNIGRPVGCGFASSHHRRLPCVHGGRQGCVVRLDARSRARLPPEAAEAKRPEATRYDDVPVVLVSLT